MSKNSKAKAKAKRDKAITRTNQKTAAIAKAIKTANERVSSIPQEFLNDRAKATKESVIFRGMSHEIARSLSQLTETLNTFPLRDFFVDVKTQYNKSIKLHWVPFESPTSKEDLCMLLQSKTYDAARNRDITVDRFPPEALIATIYASYDGVATVSFVIYNKSKNACSTVGFINATLVDMYYSDRRRYEEIIDACSYIEQYCFAVQYIVDCYLNDKELPVLPGISQEKLPVFPPKPKHPTPAPETSGRKPTDYVAYIYYDCRNGKLTISNSAKRYEMRWWIVRGHKRHLSNGVVSEVSTYIKGDKDDPAAQRALEEFTSGINRIKYYHLLARRAK